METLKLKSVEFPRDLNEWNQIVLKSPDFYTIANNPSVIKFLEKTFNWKGYSFFILNNNNIIGLIQFCVINKKCVSTPHFSYGGIIRKNKKFSKKEIFKKLNTQLQPSFEIRDFEPYTEFYNEDKVATYLVLKNSPEEQLSTFKSNHRRKINKAYKNGLKVTIGSSREYVYEFYKIYSKNMLRLGSPCLSESFFLNLLKYYNYGEVKIFLVSKKDKIIGGAVQLTYNNFAEDCWLSTLSEYNYLYSSLLLYWEMIKNSIEADLKIFSFGRSSRNSSLLNFKKQWKPEEKNIYFSYSKKQNLNIKSLTILNKLWKLLPLKFANFLGPKISRDIY